MLKTLSLTPEEGGDENAESHESESRMLRALNALSSQAPEPTGRGEQRDQRGGGFRPNRGAIREVPRGDGGGSAFAARARHRFVKDGEVPVVHMAAPRARDVAAPVVSRNDSELQRLQQLLDEQRHKLEAADRARGEAQAQLRQMQTMLAHLEMSLADMTAQAESRQQEILQLREQLREQETAVRPPRVSPAPRPDGVAESAPVKRPVGRPRTRPIEPVRMIETVSVAEAAEPEPVQWWLTPTAPAKRGRRRADLG